MYLAENSTKILRLVVPSFASHFALPGYVYPVAANPEKAALYD